MTSVIRKLNQQSWFRFVASIRLAIPLLLAMAATVAWGTIIESRYNAEMARIIVYDSTWFAILLAALWVNIFCSTLSRFPWRWSQLGFVITHIGLLTLLAGGLITSSTGVDGQLRISEGQSSDEIALSKLVFGFAPETAPQLQMVEISRSLSPVNNLSKVNAEFGSFVQVESYQPFVEVQSGYHDGGANDDVALSFILKSPFFNVSEFLHSKQNPRMQLGPARLELVVDSTHKKTAKSAAVRIEPVADREVAAAEPAQPAKASAGDFLEIVDAKSGQSLHQIRLKELKLHAQKFRGLQISLKRQFRNAVIATGGIQEGDAPQAGEVGNPALEINIVNVDQPPRREILYARFPGFSISKEPDPNFKFVYHAGGVVASSPDKGAEMSGHMGGGAGAAMPAGHPNVVADDVGAEAASAPQKIETHTNNDSPAVPAGTPPPMGSGNNLVRFRVDPAVPHQAQIELEKAGKRVMTKIVHEGETVETPWMGMKITMASLIVGAQPQNDVRPVEPQPKEQLPFGALKIRPAGSNESFWLPEDEMRTVDIGGRNYVVYFGRRLEHLPFRMQLEKFHKKDYPGTETAMSYESEVKLPGDFAPRTISMNEPMKLEGYTVYQSSYQLTPGQPAVSIFSVNRDPGRPFKYIGSLILCLGIILFTLVRSSPYRNWQKKSA